MKLYAPEYYRQFACIADKCSHNCCIGWEIDIDPDTMRKYRSLTDGYGGRIIKTIDETDTPHFRLAVGERCPHLDERGLCRIISSLGDGYLCDICREAGRTLCGNSETDWPRTPLSSGYGKAGGTYHLD